MQQPFFIVGTGRCGSTLLYNILSAHERVALTNESRVLDFLHFMTSYVGVPAPETRVFPLLEEVKLHGLVRKNYIGRFSRIVLQHAREMLEEFYRAEFADKDFTHWGDKLPSALAAQAVSEVYPHTKYIVLIRDPRDFVVSARAYTKRPEVQRQSPHFIGGMSLEQQCLNWRYTYQGCIDYLPNHMLVRYEDMVKDPLGVSRQVLDYLGLELQVDQIAKMATNRDFSKHATSATPQASMGRWQKELTASEVQTIESICHELMAKQSYPLSTAPVPAVEAAESAAS